MRKILVSLLLASAAASPALAQSHDRSDRQQAREERQQAREDRQQSREEHQQGQRGDAHGGGAVEQVNVPQANFTGGGSGHASGRFNGYTQGYAGGGGSVDHVNRYSRGGNFTGGNGGGQDGGATADTYVAPGPKMVRPDNWREQRVDARELRQSSRALPNVMRTRHPLVVSETPRPGTQPPLRVDNYRSHPQVQWSTNWRNNSHYDWQNYRHHHHSLFHLGFYIDPFGWGYQPYSIGWRLWPSYYSENYWINDPWQYRLPYAPPGYVWIRYWNDALLIDTWSGTVVDVIPNFFW